MRILKSMDMRMCRFSRTQHTFREALIHLQARAPVRMRKTAL